MGYISLQPHMVYCMSYKMAAYSLASDCIISHFSVADLPQTVPVAYWYAASLEQSFALPQTVPVAY